PHGHSSFPDEAVEGVEVLEAEAVVESEGAVVLLGDGEGEGGEAAGGEVGIAVAQQVFADAVAAIFRQGAELGDVSNVIADARAEEDSDAGLGGAMHGDERSGGIEDSAAGEAHDVVQEAQRSGDGAVLVVNIAI